jgi:hypothetical protein
LVVLAAVVDPDILWDLTSGEFVAPKDVGDDLPERTTGGACGAIAAAGLLRKKLHRRIRRRRGATGLREISVFSVDGGSGGGWSLAKEGATKVSSVFYDRGIGHGGGIWM